MENELRNDTELCEMPVIPEGLDIKIISPYSILKFMNNFLFPLPLSDRSTN